jgi:hypothetical protein
MCTIRIGHNCIPTTENTAVICGGETVAGPHSFPELFVGVDEGTGLYNARGQPASQPGFWTSLQGALSSLVISMRSCDSTSFFSLVVYFLQLQFH